MPRPEQPLDPGNDPLRQFAWDLRQLRAQAGSPGYRELAQRSHFSPSTLSAAASGRVLPTLAVTLAYVRACGGPAAEWEQRWHQLDAQLRGPYERSHITPTATDAAPAPVRRERSHVAVIAALTGLSAAVVASSAVAVLDAHHGGSSRPGQSIAVSAAPAQIRRSYDAYGCVGTDVPSTVALEPAGDPRRFGWRSSQPIPWGTRQCYDQIWWAPYFNGGVNPIETFSWTFTTSMSGKTACTVRAYYPPKPSGHAAGTAHYSIQDGASPSAPRLAYVPAALARNKGVWYRLGTFDITSGHIRITLNNLGTDLNPEHGVIAGPIRVSCG